MSDDSPRPMTLVLLTDPTLEFVARHEVTAVRPPGVVMLVRPPKDDGRVFVYAYRENPDTFVYREAVMVKA